MPYMTEDQLRAVGFAGVGRDVMVSTKASIYNAANIQIGNHVRIDDYCVLSAGDGGIAIRNYVHISVFCSLIGAARITLEDFSGLSSRVSVYSSSDDYSGKFLTNPTVPRNLLNVLHAPVVIGRHVIVGAGTVILPGVSAGMGSAIGALSVVQRDCEEFTVYWGNPARRVGARSKALLELETQVYGGVDRLK